MAYAYQSGVDLVVRETPLDYPAFPEDSLYSLEQLFDPEFPKGLNEV